MPRTDALTDRLARLGVLASERVAYATLLEQAAPDARTFLTDLARRGWLTRLQAVQAGRGRCHHLVVGQYVLLDRLGAGGMGRVFLARHRTLNRQAAVKLVRLDRRHCADTRSRFLREVRLAARLNHANVVHAYDAGFDHRAYFLAMEYVPGPDLGRVIVAEGPLDPARACEYVRQAAVGLAYMHSKGLVHRDIKPSNLGLTAGGRGVKILDMGLARRAGRRKAYRGVPEGGKLIGSADYCAPEQVTNDRLAEPRADVYALGCTLYHLLLGSVPFPGGSRTRRAMRHLTDTPRPVEEVRPGLPTGLADVVRRMMARKPEERFSTADEAARALAAFAAPITVPTPTGLTGPCQPTTVDQPTVS